MKLASLKDGRDGRLVVVSRDLSRCLVAAEAAPTLQFALDDWDNASPQLERLAAQLELGGGIRSLAAALEWLKFIDRVVLGTLAVNAPEVVDALLKEVPPERVVVSIDARNGRVAVKATTTERLGFAGRREGIAAMATATLVR